jgi:hypothetical protein
VCNSAAQRWIFWLRTKFFLKFGKSIAKKKLAEKDKNLDDHENLNAKKHDYWLGGTVTTTNRFSTLSEENIDLAAKPNTEPKPPPIFISGVKNIKHLIELRNETAKDKYLVKTLYNDQVRIQPIER